MVVRRIDTADERARDVALRTWEALTTAGLEARDPRALQLEAGRAERCRSNKVCLGELARELGSDWFALVDVGHIDDEMAVRLELVVGAHLDRAELIVFTLKTAAYPGGLQQPLAQFAKACATRLRADAPLETPGLSPPLQVAAPRSRAPAIIATTATAAGLAFTVVSLVSASVINSRIEAAKFSFAGAPASRLTRDDASRLVNDANFWWTASLIAGITTAALTALTTWLWLD